MSQNSQGIRFAVVVAPGEQVLSAVKNESEIAILDRRLDVAVETDTDMVGIDVAERPLEPVVKLDADAVLESLIADAAAGAYRIRYRLNDEHQTVGAVKQARITFGS